MRPRVSAARASVLPATLAPLRNPIFRSIWLSTQVSSLGWLIQTVAISWLMATISTSDLMVALVQASSTLPAFVLSIFAGAIADNFSRRAVMLIGRCVFTIAFAVMTALLAVGLIDPWMILCLSFVGGCGIALVDPAWQASVGDIVDRREIPAAVTLLSVGYNTIRSVGPALGGIIVASFGPLTAFVLGTASFLVPLGVLWRIKWEGPTSSLPRERMRTAIYDGLRFTAMSSEIKATITRGTLFGLAGISILALLPLVVRDVLKQGPVAYGTLMGGFGVGAFAGGMFNSLLRRSVSQERLVALACLACAACSLSLSATHSVLIAAGSLALGGAGWVTAWSGLGVIVQMASPRWIAGRTISIYYALTYGGIAAGSWLWGTVAQHYSVAWAMAGSGGAMLLVAATGLWLPIRESRELETVPSGDYSPPRVAFDLRPRSGPIVAKIEYHIQDENIPAFLGLMRARRHAQSRVGARYWTLQRNLQAPSQWTEAYRTPTWADYLRLNHRLTTADQELNQRLLELHSGALPPQLTLNIERPTAGILQSDEWGPLTPPLTL